MINERDMVYSWLDGDNIDTKHLYRTCRLLTKFFYEKYEYNRIRIRESIFDWANSNNIFIDFDLNDCIDSTLDYEYTPLKDEKNPIYVSEYDIASIIDRFDNKNIRLIAFGMLLYAKQFGVDGEFILPITAFGDWIGISGSNIVARYLEPLQNYEYIEKVETTPIKWRSFSKSRKIRKHSSKFRMLISIENVGFYKITDNNINKAFNELFRYSDGEFRRKIQVDKDRVSEKVIYEWFEKNYKLILGEDCCLFKVSNKESLIPDFMIVKNGELYPVECKVGAFNYRALSQLEGYLNYYRCNKGIAIGNKLKAPLDENIKFVQHPY